MGGVCRDGVETSGVGAGTELCDRGWAELLLFEVERIGVPKILHKNHIF